MNQSVEAEFESKANNPQKQKHKFPSDKYFHCLACGKLLYN